MCRVPAQVHFRAFLKIAPINLQLGGALAGKQIFYTVWSKNQLPRRMLTLLDFGSFLKFPKIVGKSSACPVGVFSMQPNPPKCHIRQKSRKTSILQMKLQIP